MLDFVSKENSFQTKVNPTTDTVQKKELVDNSSESVYDNLKNGINTIQMKGRYDITPKSFIKSLKGRSKLGRIIKGGKLGQIATEEGGYGSDEERRDISGLNPEYYGQSYNEKTETLKNNITIDIPGKKKGSTNKLRGYKCKSMSVKSNGKAVILFSGSGGSNVVQLLPIAEQYAQQGYVCYGIDYRGFGHSGTEEEVLEMEGDKPKSKTVYSSGMISENRIYEDSRIIYNYVLSQGFSPNNIILHGFSLGGAVASNLAVEISTKANKKKEDSYKLGGLVLHSPMTSTSEMGKSQGREMAEKMLEDSDFKQLSGIGAMIGGMAGSIATKGAMGSMSTKKNLDALSKLDADLPVAFMSGIYDMIRKNDEGEIVKDENGNEIHDIGDHLDYKHTGIANYFKGNNVIKNDIVNADHLSTGKFDSSTMKHMETWKNMRRSGQTPTTQTKSIDSVRHTPSSEQTVQGKFESSNNTGLPDGLKTNIESLSGYSMNDVKVHYNSPKPAQMKALAYTQGTDIHVAPGQEKHLGHEAWHVVQQKQGRVQPTTQMKGVNINDNASLEREADIMGTKATQLKAINNKDTVQKKTIQ